MESAGVIYQARRAQRIKTLEDDDADSEGRQAMDGRRRRQQGRGEKRAGKQKAMKKMSTAREK